MYTNAKKIINSCLVFLLKYKKISLIGIILIISFFIYYFSNNTTNTVVTYNLTQVKRGDISKVVSAVGLVQSETQVDIRGNSSGGIKTLNVIKGQNVSSGHVIATLDQTNALNILNISKNNLKSAEAKYRDFKAGVTGIDLDVINNSLEDAKKSHYNNTKNTLLKLRSVYLSSFDLVQGINFYKKELNSYTFDINNVHFNNFSLENSIVLKRQEIDTIFEKWDNRIKDLNKDFESLDFYNATEDQKSAFYRVLNTELLNSQKDIDFIYSYFDDVNVLFVNNTNGDEALIKNYKTLSANNRSGIFNNKTNIESYRQSLDNSLSAFKNAEVSYKQKVETPKEVDEIAQEIALSNARANLEKAKADFENTVIRSPFDGVIGSVNATIGDSAGTSVATIISKNKIIKSTLAEADINFISIGQEVDISFDVIEGKTFKGKISSLDVLGKVSQGVATYDVFISIDERDEKGQKIDLSPIMPNMTAEINIKIAEAKDVMYVENDSLKRDKDNKFFLQKIDPKIIKDNVVTNLTLSSNNFDKIFINIGISNDDFTEIRSDIVKINDYIVLKQNASTTVGAAQQTSILNLFNNPQSRNSNTRLNMPRG